MKWQTRETENNVLFQDSELPRIVKKIKKKKIGMQKCFILNDGYNVYKLKYIYIGTINGSSKTHNGSNR